MPIPNRKLKKARSLGLPNISYRNLSKCSRTKLKQFEKNGFVKYNTPEGVYYYKDNDSNILAVASLDNKMPPLHTSTLRLHDDMEFYCPAIGNKAGVYAIVDYLPQIMKNNVYDILLTTGSNRLQTSGRYFKPHMRKKYKWVFSFDQEGTGVATYQYFDVGIAARLVGSGWQVTAGVYSDIVDLEHLRCKMFNFGIGVHNGDTMKAYLSRNEFMSSMMKFMRFWKANKSSAFSHTPVYNAYIIGRGFMYYEDRENKKCFTDEEMDIIEILENVGFEFEDWTTMIVPEDIPELILAYQKITSDEIYLREMEKYKKSQGDLFNPAPKFKNRIRSGSEDNPEFGLTADEVQKNYHNKFNNPNSKDYDPDGFERYTRYGRKAVLPSKRPRKVGVMTKTSNDVVYTVEHRPKSEIEALKNNNISDTTYADECIRCHKIFEVSIDAAELVCPDCLGTEEDVKYFDEKVEDRKRKAVRIHKIPLRVRKEGERAYDFDETKSNWFEIGEEVDITTKSRTKRDKKVRYRKIYKPDGSAIEQYW